MNNDKKSFRLLTSEIGFKYTRFLYECFNNCRFRLLTSEIGFKYYT